MSFFKHIAGLVLLLVFCTLASQTARAAEPDLSVLHDFGDKPGLARVMDDFMVNLLADARISQYFAKTDQAKLKAGLIDQFCALLGGDCRYQGAAMDEVHAGLNIGVSDFNALVEDLQAAMDKNNVPFRSQNKLLARLAPMHRVVVTR
ncbi:group 1 truncated hemoglobin [Chitinimonas sp.]|uniref:group I truncated hemoglobin n=1 Tax=Chitinimonas sp. TaxID=1934313 RepID=UPI0035B4A7DD